MLEVLRELPSKTKNFVYQYPELHQALSCYWLSVVEIQSLDLILKSEKKKKKKQRKNEDANLGGAKILGGKWTIFLPSRISFFILSECYCLASKTKIEIIEAKHFS